MRHLGPSAARCEATARPASASGLAVAAALLGYVRGLERLDTQADGDLAELLQSENLFTFTQVTMVRLVDLLQRQRVDVFIAPIHRAP